MEIPILAWMIPFVFFQILIGIKDLVILHRLSLAREQVVINVANIATIMNEIKRMEHIVKEFSQEQERHYAELSNRMQVYAQNLAFVQQELLKVIK